MKKAFTLIELLVVVLIIGILSAIALPQYRMAVAKTQYATVKQLVTAIKNAQEVYYLANGSYTTSVEDLDIDFPANDSKRWCGISATQSMCNITTAAGRVGYQVYYDHISGNFAARSRKRICVAFSEDENAPTNKLCKAETGGAGRVNEGYTSWEY